MKSKETMKLENRHELKYVLTPIQYILLQGRLKWVMQPDENARESGEYFIRSVYFDSPDRRALREKQNGIHDRRKYRIRFYNGDASKCRLECKEKTGTRIAKRGQPLVKAETDMLLGASPEGLTKRDSFQQNLLQQDSLLQELQLCIASEGFAPVVTVDYVREAYVLPQSDLRVTFDKEIAWGPVEDCLNHERYLSNTYIDKVVLEVKYNEYLPGHISDILSSVGPIQTAVSKYVACVESQHAAKGY